MSGSWKGGRGRGREGREEERKRGREGGRSQFTEQVYIQQHYYSPMTTSQSVEVLDTSYMALISE